MAWGFDPERPVRDRPPLTGVYRRIGRFLGEFRRDLGLGLGLSALSTLLFVLLPFPVKLLIDGVLIDDVVDLGPLGTLGAAIGVGRDLVGVTKECEGDVVVSRRASALDQGFAPGHEDDYRALLQWWCAELAGRGATHLAVFTSATSPTYGVVSELAESIEEFDFWAFDLPEPESIRSGFYVDPVYF